MVWLCFCTFPHFKALFPTVWERETSVILDYLADYHSRELVWNKFTKMFLCFVNIKTLQKTVAKVTARNTKTVPTLVLSSLNFSRKKHKGATLWISSLCYHNTHNWV